MKRAPAKAAVYGGQEHEHDADDLYSRRTCQADLNSGMVVIIAEPSRIGVWCRCSSYSG
jgi:hypothetical protein